MTGIIGKLTVPTLRWWYWMLQKRGIWRSKWRPRDVTVFTQNIYE